MTCEPACGEMEEFMLPSATVTSITLRVEEMCQSGEGSVDQLEVIGEFVKTGKTHQMKIILAY